MGGKRSDTSHFVVCRWVGPVVYRTWTRHVYDSRGRDLTFKDVVRTSFLYRSFRVLLHLSSFPPFSLLKSKPSFRVVTPSFTGNLCTLLVARTQEWLNESRRSGRLFFRIRVVDVCRLRVGRGGTDRHVDGTCSLQLMCRVTMGIPLSRPGSLAVTIFWVSDL